MENFRSGEAGNRNAIEAIEKEAWLGKGDYCEEADCRVPTSTKIDGQFRVKSGL